ncbi:hypothetical protein Gotur_025749, partial [Gossypium turneri]
NYLREADFWHVATIGRGCKLDPKLISALVERWRPETYTSHLPCGECTITLEYVNLQLGLQVDGYPVTGFVQSGDWGAIIRGYLMSDLSRNLVHLRWLLKLVNFRVAGELNWGSTVLVTLYREMCRATRPRKAKIGGCLLLLQSWARFRFPFLRPQVDHPYTFPLITRWNHPASYARLLTSLEDIRLLLDQQSEAHFQWTPYEDPIIRAVIPHVQTECHGNFDVDNRFPWHLRFWSYYIQMWEDRYDYIPTRESIIVSELACMQKYMSWFRIHGKSYLLSTEERR